MLRERGDALSQRDRNDGTEMGEIVSLDSFCLLQFLAVILDLLYISYCYVLAGAACSLFVQIVLAWSFFAHHSTSAIELTSQDVELNQFKIEKDRF